MICFTDTTTNPYHNLATEEMLLRNVSGPVFRLWRNSPSVIIGRYQNALAEINTDYVQQHNIPVVRRLTGGGAVFHDLGNINYTFIDRRIPGEDVATMFRRFTAPVIEALQALGVNASLQGRNDIVIDGRKISGNAVCVHGDRVLQHGCILFSASVADLSAALNTRPEKFTGKSVQSNRARVTNISDHLPAGVQMDAPGFMAYLQEYVTRKADCRHRTYTPEEEAATEALMQERYSTWEWNYGSSPKYGFSQCRKFPAGFVEVSLDVKDGIIRNCAIRGDYFFTRPTEEVETALQGIRHDREALLSALTKLPLNEYFGALSGDELLEVLL